MKTGMAIPPDIMRHCLDSAKEFTEEYKRWTLGGDHSRKFMDEMVGRFSDYLETKIEVVEIKMPKMGPTKAIYIAYNDRVVIKIRSGHSPEWRRFLLCKELFHIVLDKDDESRSTSLYDEIAAMRSPAITETNSKGAVWEDLAVISAMEFLFPYADREAILRNGNDIDYAAKAKQYGIPQSFIESYLLPQSMDYFAAFRMD